MDEDEDEKEAMEGSAPPSSMAAKKQVGNKEATIKVSLPSIVGPSEASLGPSGVALDPSNL